MATQTEQVESDGTISVCVDQLLPPDALNYQVTQLLPGSKYTEFNSVQCIVYNGVALFLKQITYLGNPHPINKKRIQITKRMCDAYEEAVSKGYNVRFIGVYSQNDNLEFVDFNPKNYLVSGNNTNSSAHISVEKLRETVVSPIGMSEFHDKNMNSIIVIKKDQFRNYLNNACFENYETGKIPKFEDIKKHNDESENIMNENDENSIDITPPVAIYDYFKKLSYEPKYALAEFIDNSTQSFFDHENELQDNVSAEHQQPHVVIKIDIQEDCITIVDNAYGMDITDFKRAVQLMKPPQNQGGRNEFGMGLKTAACWFGDKWTVASTRKGVSKKFTTTVDIKKVANENLHTVEIQTDECDENIHMTVIKIENLSHDISHGNTRNKLRRDLTNMYRQDIRNKKVKIILDERFDSTPLTYEEPEPLTDQGVTYKKDIEFTVQNDAVDVMNKSNPDRPLDLKVSGFVGVLHKGDANGAGFTLVRRGRVVESNYKPQSIVGKGNDFASQRMYGELNLDGFPVTQAKDKFDWQLGIEEDFIAALNEQVKDYVQVARKYRKRKTVEAEKIIEEVGQELKNIPEISSVSVARSEHQPELTDRGDREAAEVGEDNDAQIDGDKSWKYDIALMNGTKYLITLVFDDTTTMSNWLDVSIDTNNPNDIKCTLNTRHSFFRPFISKPDFIRTLAEFSFAIVLSELESRRLSNENGLIEPSRIRLRMNDILNNIRKG